MTEDIESLSNKILPTALKSIQESKNTLDQIVSYCSNLKGTEYEKFFQQTQDYTKEALKNVAYHAHTVGTHLANFLALQLLELEKLQLHISVLAERMRLSHDRAGQLGYNTPASVKKYRVTGVKTTTASASHAPKLPEYVRRPIAVDTLLEQFGPSTHVWITSDTQPLTPVPRGHTVTLSSTTTTTTSTTTSKRKKTVSKSRNKEKDRKRHNKPSKKEASSHTTTASSSSSSVTATTTTTSATSASTTATRSSSQQNTVEISGQTTKENESHTPSEEPPLPSPPLPPTPQAEESVNATSNTIQDFTYIGDDNDDDSSDDI